MTKPNCSQRSSFDTEREALDVCAEAWRKSHRELGTYHCKHCGKWHLYNKRKSDCATDLVQQCLRKKAYHSIDCAEQVARKVLAERGVELHAYRCPHCGKIHLTKFVKKEYEQIF